MAMALDGAQAADSCHALALSGGGSNGAWEAGVIWGFVNYGNPDDYKWDVLTGVSAGSINSLGLMVHEIGQEVQAAQYLSDKWANLKTSDIWVDWSLGKVYGLVNKPGIVDNTPMLGFLQDMLKDFTQIYRRVTLAATEVDTGVYTLFDENNTSLTDFPKAATCSASVPGMFQHFIWEGRGIFMDGMTISNINVQSAIDRCMEIVDDHSKITIDVLLCGEAAPPESWDKVGNSWSNFFRYRSLHKYYNGSDAIQQIVAANPRINWRNTIFQSQSLSGLKELTFENDVTWPMQELGRQQAQDALNNNIHTKAVKNYATNPELK